jgi:hypothetical protein
LQPLQPDNFVNQRGATAADEEQHEQEEKTPGCGRSRRSGLKCGHSLQKLEQIALQINLKPKPDLFVNADERPSAYLLGVSAIQRGRRKRKFTG